MNMLENLLPLSPILKGNKVYFDNKASQLQGLSVFILLVCSIMVATFYFVGEAIVCFSTDEPLNQSQMNIHCWTQAMFTYNNKGRPGLDVVYAGVGPYQEYSTYLTYYQWIAFVLFFQAGLFYLPRYVWDNIEGGRVEAMLDGLQNDHGENMTISKDRVKKSVSYYIKSLKNRGCYTVGFVCCELIAFFNVIGQIYLMNVFLNGGFLTYGIDVLSLLWKKEEVTPMARVFPVKAKCSYLMFGISGTDELQDAMCELPANHLHDKVYLFLWYWFALVAVLSTIYFINRFATFSPWFRYRILCIGRSKTFRRQMRTVCLKSSFSDWLLLYFLEKNMYSEAYNQFIEGVAEQLEKNHVQELPMTECI